MASSASATGSSWSAPTAGARACSTPDRSRSDDIDALHDRAVAAGAEIVYPLTDQDYGSRDFAARDPFGNVWAFGTYNLSL
jgi:uncharacterized glyoxalase superfamily protein PhnB